MNCGEAAKWLEAYLDGELDALRSVELEEHVSGCGSCPQRLENLRTLRQGFAAPELRFTASHTLRKKVRRRMRDELGAGPLWGVLNFQMPWRTISFVTSFAMVAAITWSMMFATTRSGDQMLQDEVIASHVRSMMANHLTDVASSDQHTVKPWFDGKLDYSPKVNDLANEGFPLVGGRLDYLNQRPVAALVYRRHQHLINVFVWPAENGASSAQKESSRDGFNVIRWNNGGMTWYAVSNLNAEALQEFVGLLQDRQAPTAPPG